MAGESNWIKIFGKRGWAAGILGWEVWTAVLSRSREFGAVAVASEWCLQ